MRPRESYVEMGLLGAKVRWDREPPFADRFWRRVKKAGPDECWLWQGPLVKNTRYGKYKIRGKTASAHRIAYELTHGTIQSGLFVLHHCDVKHCCNPRHLFLGTAKDNAQDALKKGRLSYPRPWAKGAPPGERNWFSKLTEEKVRQIRALAATKELTQGQIAERFGVRRTHISAIVHFRSWAHLR